MTVRGTRCPMATNSKPATPPRRSSSGLRTTLVPFLGPGAATAASAAARRWPRDDGTAARGSAALRGACRVRDGVRACAGGAGRLPSRARTQASNRAIGVGLAERLVAKMKRS
jgi:hypothetical protein